jgi:glycerol-3-phosphate cytidylyltransferase-like family protein
MLEATKYVDRVIWVDNDEQVEEFIKIIKPKYRMLGSDYKDKKIV